MRLHLIRVRTVLFLLAFLKPYKTMTYGPSATPPLPIFNRERGNQSRRARPSRDDAAPCHVTASRQSRRRNPSRRANRAAVRKPVGIVDIFLVLIDGKIFCGRIVGGTAGGPEFLARLYVNRVFGHRVCRGCLGARKNL
jgi:hypothetical protein